MRSRSGLSTPRRRSEPVVAQEEMKSPHPAQLVALTRMQRRNRIAGSLEERT